MTGDVDEDFLQENEARITHQSSAYATAEGIVRHSSISFPEEYKRKV
jgi:hypothetical protein